MIWGLRQGKASEEHWEEHRREDGKVSFLRVLGEFINRDKEVRFKCYGHTTFIWFYKITLLLQSSLLSGCIKVHLTICKIVFLKYSMDANPE